jgi:hypothetical protein
MTVNTNVNLVYPETNADGLQIRYGRAEAVVNKVGDVQTVGDLHVVKVKVDYADVALGTDATHNFILSYDSVLPKGSVPVKALFTVVEAWDSTSNDVALNFGVIRQSDMEIIDADGLFDTIAKTALDTAGAELWVLKGDSSPASTTWVGAELGSARPTNQYLSCYWENHAPSQGSGILSVFYRGA